MGTRNITIVKLDDEYKVAQYGQWDGYPGGQGKVILEFLKKFDRETFIKNLRLTKFISREELRNLFDKESSRANDEYKFFKYHPQFSRDTAAGILDLIQEGKALQLFNEINFVNDSLFCEWGYVIDLDNNTFEVYTGFNQNPLPESERFYSKEPNNDGYYPIKLLKSYSLDNLPSLEEFYKLLETI